MRGDPGMKATVSEKGRVTIPKALRTRLGIGPGTVLEFHEERGRLLAQKATERNPVDEVWGTLELAEPVDAFAERIRGR
jgi:AbrB family looped-hinge helix DNA binding protein